MESKHDTKYFQSLIGRAELTENILKSIQNKSSGNDGENYFSAILDCDTDIVYLNDFQFTYNSQVQIDTIVIDDQAIYLFEIKNYKGIYYLEDMLLKIILEVHLLHRSYKWNELEMNSIDYVTI